MAVFYFHLLESCESAIKLNQTVKGWVCAAWMLPVNEVMLTDNVHIVHMKAVLYELWVSTSLGGNFVLAQVRDHEHQSNQVRIADPFDNNATVKWRFSHMWLQKMSLLWPLKMGVFLFVCFFTKMLRLGGTAVRWLALLLHRKKVLGLNLSGPFYVELACCP